MMSTIPQEYKGKETELEILRSAIMSELDATNLYEQLAMVSKNKLVKKVLLDIAKEEKTHIGEFKSVLNRLDNEQAQEDGNGFDEVSDMLKNEAKNKLYGNTMSEELNKMNNIFKKIIN